MEIQVKAKSAKGGTITVCYLFEVFDREHNEFLIELGFAANMLKKIKPFNETRLETKIPTDLSLYGLLAKKEGYMLYEGQSLFDDCEPSLFFISKDISWMSQEQYGEVKGKPQLKETHKRPINMILYQNIDPNFGKIPYQVNTTFSPRPKFPSSAKHDLFMYNPDDNETLGVIGPYATPGWETLNGSFYTITDLPPLPYGLKYLVFFYEPVYRTDFSHIPRYIIVPSSFSWTKNLQPSFVPIVIRSNIPESIGFVRPLVTLKVGIAKVDLNLLESWQKEKEQAKEEVKKKMAQEAQKAEAAKHEEAIKKAQEAAAKLANTTNSTSPNDRDKLAQQLELEKLRRAAITWERRCVRWALQAILNRHYNNEDAWDLRGVWKGGHSDLYTCIEWKDVRIGPDGQEVDEDGNPINPTNSSVPANPKPIIPGTNSTSNTTQPLNPSIPQQETPKQLELEPKLNLKKCGLYISVILNKNFHDVKFKDLVTSQCGSYMQNLGQVEMHQSPEQKADLEEHSSRLLDVKVPAQKIK